MLIKNQLYPIPVDIPVLTFKKLADYTNGIDKFLGNTISGSLIYLSFSAFINECTRYEQQSCKITISRCVAIYLLILIYGKFLTF